MNGQTITLGEIREFSDFRRSIESPELGGVGQTDHARLRSMEIAPPAQRVTEIGQIDFSVCAVNRHDTQPLVQESGGVAFVRLDV